MTHVRTFPLLSTVERQDRALAQVVEERMHSAGNFAVAGKCTASGRGLGGALQQHPREQYHGLHHAEDVVAGRQQEIRAERDRKLEAARQKRQSRRQQAALRANWLAGPRCRRAKES